METCPYIDAKLLKAAEEGELEPFKNVQLPLDRLLSPKKNTILHIYLSTLSLSERSTKFIKGVLRICPLLLCTVNAHGDTPLHIAARYGHADAAKELIERAKASTRNEIDLESGEGSREQRHYSDSEYGHADAAKELIERAKASTRNEIDLESGEGSREQRHYSDSECGEGSRESIEQANASDLESGEGSRESIEQANASDLESGEGSRESIEQANASDSEREEEPRESEMAAVRMMLRMTNKNKETALHEAARNKRSLGVVEAIMSNEDPAEFTYSSNNRGETPLYLAVKNRNGWIACELLTHPDSELLAYGGPNGKTALHEATVLDFEDDDFKNKGRSVSRS
ncbi:uncharacterized protein LOC131172039 [Hevea brasiliensis]|uniref:uncharacterized protein LOC131172039 n=1 Tax=Hevea brasiliensis TaxID=3981 RepID=UPI0025F6F8C0|nr:uncharacterized protein LOC131172039 [Hevea brasiliensis]